MAVGRVVQRQKNQSQWTESLVTGRGEPQQHSKNIKRVQGDYNVSDDTSYFHPSSDEPLGGDMRREVDEKLELEVGCREWRLK